VDNYCMIEANPALLKMLGYSHEEFTQLTFVELTHLDDRTKDVAQLELCQQGELNWYSIEKRYMHKAGHPVWVRMIINVISDDQQNPLYTLGLVEDISQQRQMKSELEEALNELRFHFENTPLAVVKWDADFRVTHWSSQSETMFGFLAEEVVGTSLNEWHFVVEPDQEQVQAVIGKLKSGTEKRNRCCNRNYTKSGEIVHCEWYNSALWDEESNKLKSVLSLVLNVTDRSRAFSELEQSIALLEAIINSTADGIVTLTMDGKVQHHNDKFVQLWQIPGKILDSRDDRDLVAFQKNQVIKPAAFLAQIQSELENPELENQGLVYLKNGHILERHSVAQRVNDLVVGRVVSYRDMTLLRQTQASLSFQVQQWQSLVSNLPGAVFRHAIDDNWTVQYVSETIELVTGYPAADYIGNYKRTFAADDYPEDEPRVRAAVNQAIADRQPYIVEYRIIHRDGTIRWVWEKGRVIFANPSPYIDGVLFEVKPSETSQNSAQASPLQQKLSLLPLFSDKEGMATGQ
jgi:PAS domain S-box-containing protein